MSARHVVVVGGGASGTIAAAHILRDPEPNLHVTILEPAQHLGRGLAYGTDAPSYLLNARARSMSAFDDQPSDLLDWLAANIGSASWADRYIERRLYGRYLESLLPPAAPGRRRLTHIRAAAVNLVEHADGVRVDLDDGAAVVGQAAVLAIGHGLLAEPPRARQTVPKGDVLILGTGLGMVDEVLGLLDAGHAGHIVALSRRGQLPQPHGARGEMRLDAADVPLGTNLSYLMRWLRAEVRAGAPWGDLVDALRPHVPQVWGSLPLEARRRFLRHARPWWDSHRHRMAPSIARAHRRGPRGGPAQRRRRAGDRYGRDTPRHDGRLAPSRRRRLPRGLLRGGGRLHRPAVRAGRGRPAPALPDPRRRRPRRSARHRYRGHPGARSRPRHPPLPLAARVCSRPHHLPPRLGNLRHSRDPQAMRRSCRDPRRCLGPRPRRLARRCYAGPRPASQHVSRSFFVNSELSCRSIPRVIWRARRCLGLHRVLAVRQPTGRGSRLLGGRGCQGRQRWRRAPRRHLQQQLRRRWRRNRWRLC